MRKQDRVRQQQNRGDQHTSSESESPRREQEQMKGKAATEQQNPPSRPSGKMPLPD